MDIRDTILARLRSGEQAIDIANEYADMLNSAVDEYEAEVAAAKAKETERNDAIANLANAFNGFFDVAFPGLFDESITNDMMAEVMNIVESAFKSGASGYTIQSRSETGKKPEVKVTLHGATDKIAKFLKDNNLK